MTAEQEKVKEETCCVCGHKLGKHADEGDGYRCHCLGPDGYQCECYLRKRRYVEGLAGYSVERRTQKFIEELRGDR